MKYKKSTLLIILFSLIFIIYKIIFNQNFINQEEAEIIADKNLSLFAQQRKISINDFEKAEIRRNGNQWEIFYKGRERNDLLVNILVSKTGQAEVHSTRN